MAHDTYSVFIHRPPGSRMLDILGVITQDETAARAWAADFGYDPVWTAKPGEDGNTHYVFKAEPVGV